MHRVYSSSAPDRRRLASEWGETRFNFLTMDTLSVREMARHYRALRRQGVSAYFARYVLWSSAWRATVGEVVFSWTRREEVVA